MPENRQVKLKCDSAKTSFEFKFWIFRFAADWNDCNFLALEYIFNQILNLNCNYYQQQLLYQRNEFLLGHTHLCILKYF